MQILVSCSVAEVRFAGSVKEKKKSSGEKCRCLSSSSGGQSSVFRASESACSQIDSWVGKEIKIRLKV